MANEDNFAVKVDGETVAHWTATDGKTYFKAPPARELPVTPRRWREILETALEHASAAWAKMSEAGAKEARPDMWPPKSLDEPGTAAYHTAAMIDYMFETYCGILRVQPEDDDIPENLTHIDVKACQRCGKNHGVYFSDLENAVDGFNLWGMCPNKNQPILLKKLDFEMNGNMLIIDSVVVPFVTVERVGGTDGTWDGDWNITLDNRFGVRCNAEEIQKWGWFLANAMAVASGLTSHGVNARPMDNAYADPLAKETLSHMIREAMPAEMKGDELQASFSKFLVENALEDSSSDALEIMYKAFCAGIKA